MDDLPLMYKLYSLNHLVADHQSAFQSHYFVIFDENILDACAEQVHEHDIVLTFGSDRTDFGYSNYILGRI